MVFFFSGMQYALEAAYKALQDDEVPVGAAIIDPYDNRVIATAGNAMRTTNDPTAHAEILVIRKSCQILGVDRLSGLDLYSTLEPCPMCATAIALAKINRLYYGAADPTNGAVHHGARVYSLSGCNHIPEIYSGIQENECHNMLAIFFHNKRQAAPNT